MKSFKRGEKGFTLIELLIVVAILGILAAVVIPNVVGLMGRGGKQAYNTDVQTIQLATAAFYADTQKGWYDSVAANDPTGPSGYGNQSTTPLFNDNVWGGNTSGNDQFLEGFPGHYYPTAIAKVGNLVLTLSTTDFDENNVNNYRIILTAAAGGRNALDADIQAHAIWMGLLTNKAGDSNQRNPGFDSKTAAVGSDIMGNRLLAAPRTGMDALYLNEVPKSASDMNGNTLKPGGYVWVAGESGRVFGAYVATNGGWYSGFSGAYP